MIKDSNTKFTLWKLGTIPRFYSATFEHYPIWSYRGWNFPATSQNKQIPIYEIEDFHLHHPDLSIDKNRVNILLLHPYDIAMCDGAEFKKDIFDYEWMRKYTDIALENNFKIIIDSSYDLRNAKHLALSDPFFKKDNNYVLNNDIKYLTHIPPVNYYKLHSKYIEAEEEAKSQKYKEIEKHLIEFKTFKYQVRAQCGNDLNTYPTNKYDKKYFFSLFFGEITCPDYRLLSFYQFDKRNLQKHAAWSTFVVDDPEIGTPNFDRDVDNLSNSQYLPLRELVINNKNKLKSFAQNKPHERYDVDKLYSNIDWTDKSINTNALIQFDELKMPQCAFDSHLYVTYESFCSHVCWYTEKSWKPIAHGFPFIIHGCYLQNRYLKKLGYEIFEEIIDYSFEETAVDPNNDHEWVYNYDIKFFDELERLVKEGPNLFYQPIIQEKIKHNRNLFFKETTTEKFLEDFERTFVHDTKD